MKTMMKIAIATEIPRSRSHTPRPGRAGVLEPPLAAGVGGFAVPAESEPPWAGSGLAESGIASHCIQNRYGVDGVVPSPGTADFAPLRQTVNARLPHALDRQRWNPHFLATN